MMKTSRATVLSETMVACAIFALIIVTIITSFHLAKKAKQERWDQATTVASRALELQNSQKQTITNKTTVTPQFEEGIFSHPDLSQPINYEPIYFGNGVYFFRVVGDDFRRALSHFIGSHTNLDLITGFSDVERQNQFGPGFYGATTGHTAVFRKKDH